MSTLKKILLVDDDADHLRLCAHIFKRRGNEVLSLLGCGELKVMALAVETFQPDLIFMDHNMPGICGMDITRMLKANPLFRHIPVIYFSGEENLGSLAEQAGADDWLKKPFELDSLLMAASKFIG